MHYPPPGLNYGCCYCCVFDLFNHTGTLLLLFYTISVYPYTFTTFFALLLEPQLLPQGSLSFCLKYILQNFLQAASARDQLSQLFVCLKKSLSFTLILEGYFLIPILPWQIFYGNPLKIPFHSHLISIVAGEKLTINPTTAPLKVIHSVPLVLLRFCFLCLFVVVSMMHLGWISFY